MMILTVIICQTFGSSNSDYEKSTSDKEIPTNDYDLIVGLI